MPHKIKRKLIRVGNTSIAVILPISWLRYHNLKYGDRVEVVSNGFIEIKPEGKKLNLNTNKETICDIERQIDNVIMRSSGGINSE